MSPVGTNSGVLRRGPHLTDLNICNTAVVLKLYLVLTHLLA